MDINQETYKKYAWTLRKPIFIQYWYIKSKSFLKQLYMYINYDLIVQYSVKN